MGQRTDRLWWLAVALMVSALACGDSTTTPTTVSTLSGDWGIFEITTTSCPSSLPFGYSVAPRGEDAPASRRTEMSLTASCSSSTAPRGRCTERSPTATSSRCG